MLKKAELKKLFNYDPDGFLIWKKQPHRRGDLVGKRAGWTRPLPSPRRHIQIGKKLYYEHRLIFAWHFGFYPKQIDHINRNPIDNRIENLRPASASQNLANSKTSKRNISGIKGVHFCKTSKKWIVRLWYKRKLRLNKSFKSLRDAFEERQKAEKQFFKQFTPGGAP